MVGQVLFLRYENQAYTCGQLDMNFRPMDEFLNFSMKFQMFLWKYEILIGKKQKFHI